jgi:hypothetical protein
MTALIPNLVSFRPSSVPPQDGNQGNPYHYYNDGNDSLANVKGESAGGGTERL